MVWNYESYSQLPGREIIHQIEARGDNSYGDDPLEGLDGDDKDKI